MKIVVFGGSGFLGSYVIDELIKRDFIVINADVNPPKYNVENQIYKKVDILDINTIYNVISDDTDFVYNFLHFVIIFIIVYIFYIFL